MVKHLRDSAESDGWEPPVLLTVASEGEGISALAKSLDEHARHLAETGVLGERRRAAALEHTRMVLERTMSRRAAAAWTRVLAVEGDPLAAGEPPYEVARRIAARLCPPEGAAPAEPHG